jgi:hypothetical protein
VPAKQRADPFIVAGARRQIIGARNHLAVRAERDQQRHAGIPLLIRGEIVADGGGIGGEQRLQFRERRDQSGGQRDGIESIALHATGDLLGARQVRVDGRGDRARRHRADDDPGRHREEREQTARDGEHSHAQTSGLGGIDGVRGRRLIGCRADCFQVQSQIARRPRPIGCLFLQTTAR